MHKESHKNKLTSKKLLLTAAFIILFAVLYLVLPWDNIWYQNYTPVNNNVILSSIIAFLPVIIMFVMLAGFKIPAYKSAITALIMTLFLSIFVWRMPFRLAALSTLLGMAVGIFPIFWTLSSAVWIFNMLVESGFFEIIKESLKKVSEDRRIQTLLIGFGFITLLESLAAFGAPIAIGISMLVGLGFPPLLAGTIALLADTSPSAFGTQGMPIVVLNSVTGLDIGVLGKMVASQTTLISALFPVGLVILVSGWKGFKEIWHITLMIGVIYSVTVIATASYMGPYTAGIFGAIAAILAIFIIMRFWKIKKIWQFPSDKDNKILAKSSSHITPGKIVQAWSPYIALVLIIALVNNTGLKAWLDSISNLSMEWKGLHNIVWKVAPIVDTTKAYPAVYAQKVLTTGGTLVFITGLLTIFLLRIPLKKALKIYFDTVRKLLLPGITIVCILGISYLMNYSAMAYTIGLAFAASGALFPFASVFLGMLGCTMAGSVAGSNALFGNLAIAAGNQIGIDPVFAVGTLCSGGVMGKSIAPQDLVIASAALDMNGNEGSILKRVTGITLIYTLILALWVMLQYYFFPWMIP